MGNYHQLLQQLVQEYSTRILIFLSKMSEATPYLDLMSQAFSENVGVIPADVPVEQFREELEELQKHKKLGGVTREKFVVSFEDGVTTWIYKPVGHGKEAHPVIFYLHGGAWFSGT